MSTGRLTFPSIKGPPTGPPAFLSCSSGVCTCPQIHGRTFICFPIPVLAPLSVSFSTGHFPAQREGQAARSVRERGRERNPKPRDEPVEGGGGASWQAALQTPDGTLRARALATSATGTGSGNSAAGGQVGTQSQQLCPAPKKTADIQTPEWTASGPLPNAAPTLRARTSSPPALSTRSQVSCAYLWLRPQHSLKHSVGASTWRSLRGC